MEPSAEAVELASRVVEADERRLVARAEEELATPAGTSQDFRGEQQRRDAAPPGDQDGRPRRLEGIAAPQRAEDVEQVPGSEPREGARPETDRPVEESQQRRSAARAHAGDAHRSRQQHRSRRAQEDLNELPRRRAAEVERDLDLQPAVTGPVIAMRHDARARLAPGGG